MENYYKKSIFEKNPKLDSWVRSILIKNIISYKTEMSSERMSDKLYRVIHNLFRQKIGKEGFSKCLQ